jgi:hypothetical protein
VLENEVGVEVQGKICDSHSSKSTRPYGLVCDEVRWGDLPPAMPSKSECSGVSEHFAVSKGIHPTEVC